MRQLTPNHRTQCFNCALRASWEDFPIFGVPGRDDAGVMDGVRTWKKDAPAVRKRGQQILTKLCEEGLSEEFELQSQYSQSDIYAS
ncbi:hypothetical protein BLNAU_23362 [Blattamonas nauphoetae]|uniref:Uncharacterized protein n=1 Tax=Blattamonas nauphoetae TaxID=2049346 RepID=A0ABQ9WUM8_9EUKA|nr:hypothetical protein BLNAU_23362 [Blattamonas nauphoetae]